MYIYLCLGGGPHDLRPAVPRPADRGGQGRGQVRRGLRLHLQGCVQVCADRYIDRLIFR